MFNPCDGPECRPFGFLFHKQDSEAWERPSRPSSGRIDQPSYSRPASGLFSLSWITWGLSSLTVPALHPAQDSPGRVAECHFCPWKPGGSSPPHLSPHCYLQAKRRRQLRPLSSLPAPKFRVSLPSWIRQEQLCLPPVPLKFITP